MQQRKVEEHKLNRMYMLVIPAWQEVKVIQLVFTCSVL